MIISKTRATLLLWSSTLTSTRTFVHAFARPAFPLISTTTILNPTNSYNNKKAFATSTSLAQSSSNVPTSESSTMSSSIEIELPKPIAVSPGTSPLEQQDVTKNPIDDTTVILIVGATRGIGLEFVKQCLAKKATVIATHRQQHDETPSTLQNLREQYSETLHTLPLDLASESSIENAATTLKSMNLSPLTHIIHNGGIYLPGTSFDGKARGPRAAAPKVDKETLMKTFEINTIAPLLIAQNFIPLMSARSDVLMPVISFLSSKVGSVDDNGSGGAYAYRSSKSALNNIAKSLSVDLAQNARVVLLHPGYVKTDMTGGKGLIDTSESVGGMIKAVESTDAFTGFRFVDFKACLISW